MVNTTIDHIVNTALDKSNIQHRSLKYDNETLYFARLCNGLTFDMIFKQDGILRLWRFIHTGIPMDRINVRFEYSKSKCENENETIGLRLTEEGDLELSLEKKYDNLENLNVEEDIQKKIDEFSKIISNYYFRNVQK